MLNPSLGTMPQYKKLALDHGFTMIYNEDISKPAKKTWDRLMSVQNIGKITKLLVLDLTLWARLFHKPKNVGENLLFLKSSWNMKNVYTDGVFLVAVQRI